MNNLQTCISCSAGPLVLPTPSVLAVKQLDSIMESDDDDAFLYGDEEPAGGEGQVKQEQLAGAPYQGEHRTVLARHVMVVYHK